MTSPTRERLQRARNRRQKSIDSYRQIGNRQMEVHHLLKLAELERDLGDADRAVRALRAAERALANVLDAENSTMREQRAALDRLWKPFEAERTEPAPSASASSIFNLAAELTFVWAGLNPERALLEVEKQKSSALLQVMQDDRRERDEGLLSALSSLGADEVKLIRPMCVDGVREAFIDYFVGESETLVFLERAGEPIRCFTVEVGRTEVDTVVERMQRRFDGGGMFMPIIPDAPEAVPLDEIYALGRRLLPFIDDLEATNLVCVFPHGALHSFPFAAVPVGDGSPLIEHAAVVYSLSRRTLAVARAASRSVAGSRFSPCSALTVGVPACDEPDPYSFLGEAEFLASLRALDQEPVGLETPRDATVEGVLSRMGNYDLVHFNCHARFSATFPLDSCLLLSAGASWPNRTGEADAGHLDARTVMHHKRDVRTEMVVLRACSSGVTNLREGDEQEGLLRAFIHIGIATCVVTSWKIDAPSSRELIRAFYRHWLVDKLPKGLALQRAQRDLREDQRTCLHHPFHWAPFKMIGDWR